MNQDPATFDPRIADWLEGDPNTAPDQALQVVLAAVPSIKQRRTPRLPWRALPMSPFARIATAVLVVAIAVGGVLLLTRPSGSTVPAVGAGASPSPTAATPSARSSASPTSASTAAAGTRPAGTFSSAFFKPVVSVDLPAGWRLRNDDPELLWLDQGQITLAFHLMAADVSADSAAKLLGLTAASMDPAPSPATLGEAQGFTADFPRLTTGTETLFFKPGLNPFDAPRGDRVKVWVVGAGGRPVSITLVAPDGSFDDALTEVNGILATLTLQP